MRTGVIRRGALMVCGAAALAMASLAGTSAAQASGLTFSLATLSQYGGEPSIVSDHNGILYDTSPEGPVTYRSSDQGASWTEIQSADNNSGDDCLGVDEANVLHWCNLASGTASQLPLQADDWHSNIAETCTANCNWVHGTGVAGSTCGTSCSPFGVDRQWVAASNLNPTPNGYTGAEVALMYHDFYGPSQIWVNISKDGGNTFGPPIEVLANSPTPGAVIAQGFTLCNTVPLGVGIVPPGKPHAGRIYVSWIAADLPQNATGCNISMAESFHTAWVAWSDNNGTTWDAQQAYDAGVGHDMSSPFAAFTLDNEGNPYLGVTTPEPGENFAACSAETEAGVQTDASCDYHMFVVWCQCGGSSVTFDGGGGVVPGSAATPYEVDGGSAYGGNGPQPGSDVFPTIAALDPGNVDVSWLHTDEIVPTTENGKFAPGGCAGPSEVTPTFPSACPWNLYGAQSTDLTAAPGSETWTIGQATTTPSHVGDICNLGIACIPGLSNRNLLDFDQETIDPTTGCAHIAYADDNTVNKLRVANQTSDCLPTQPVANVPEAPLAPLFIPAAVVAAAGTGMLLRRRRGSRAS